MGQKGKDALMLQMLNILFSLNSIFIKISADRWRAQGFFTLPTLSALAAAVMILGVYAIFWQRVIKRVALSTAYLSKGLVVFWTLLWSAIFFGEGITLWNILGAAVIVIGTVMVADHE